MRAFLHRRLRAVLASVRPSLALLLAAILVACGGGGGGGSSTPAGAFTLSASTATFSAYQNTAPPASRSLTMSITGSRVAYVGAAYTGGQTQPAWLGIDVTGSGTAFNVVIRILSTSLAPGQYSSTFAVGTADANGTVLQQQNITVTYTVTARLGLTATPTLSQFTFGDTRTTQAVEIGVQAGGRQWALTSSAAWLQVPTAAQNGSATLAGTIDTAGLAPGSYTARLSATNSTDANDTASVDVSITITPASLAVTEDSVLLGGTDGRADTLAQALHFAVATGNGTHPYTVTLATDSGGQWLAVDSASGLVGSAGSTVTLTASRAGLVGGTYTAQVQVSVDVRGTVFTELVPVTLNIEASRIVTAAAGVGLSRVPGRDVLSRSVRVHSNLGRTDVPWAARSDAAWLSVTASGLTGGALVLTADPTGLAADTTHFAEVTITSPDARVENQQSIRVGLYVAGTAPVVASVTDDAAFLATSPVEPLVAVADGGTAIELRDVYSGALVRTLPGVAASTGGLAWSGDGRTLYVHDRTNLRVVAVSPQSGAQLASFPDSPTTAGDPVGRALAFVQPDGYPMLVTPAARLIDLASGAEMPAPTFVIARYARSLAVSPDQSLVVPDFGSVKQLRRSALLGGTLVVSDGLGFGTAQGREGEACVSAVGDRIYTASGFPYDFPATSVTTGQIVQRLPGSAYPNSIQCVWNGLVVGGIDGYYDGTDVWVYYGPTGVELGRLSSAASSYSRTLLERGLAVSADGTRLISVANDGQLQLYFQDLPSPP